MKLVEKIENFKIQFKITYSVILNMISLCSTTFHRWRDRIRKGLDPVKKAGSHPVKPLDFKQLRAELDALVHSSQRSGGVGKLRQIFQGTISRRDLDEMVERARQEYIFTKKSDGYELKWHIPGAVWSMDVFEMKREHSARKYYVLTVQDLATRYKFPPLSTLNEPQGHEVADHLKRLFDQFGKPLFLKRDNAGNLNDHSIRDLLSQSHVLPLNNPIYYAPYNGAIEHTQGEFKQRLVDCFSRVSSFKEFALCVELIAHDLNHGARRKLHGANSCSKFNENSRRTHSKRKRQEVFLWISNLVLRMMESKKSALDRASAWRIACRMWLEKNNYVTISKKQKVLPHFFEIFARY